MIASIITNNLQYFIESKMPLFEEAPLFYAPLRKKLPINL